jgi:hypothetical protein
LSPASSVVVGPPVLQSWWSPGVRCWSCRLLHCRSRLVSVFAIVVAGTVLRSCGALLLRCRWSCGSPRALAVGVVVVVVAGAVDGGLESEPAVGRPRTRAACKAGTHPPSQDWSWGKGLRDGMWPWSESWKFCGSGRVERVRKRVVGQTVLVGFLRGVVWCEGSTMMVLC